jgi:hypothetical protein
MTFLEFLQLLVQLGPQFAVVWRVVMTLVNEFNFGQKLPLAEATLSHGEQTHVETLRSLSATHGGLAGAAFSIQDVLRVFNFVQQHPELVTAIQAIIAAFMKPKPTPQPSPAPPAAI